MEHTELLTRALREIANARAAIALGYQRLWRLAVQGMWHPGRNLSSRWAPMSGHARQAQLWIATMQTLVSPLVDVAGSLIGGMTLAEGDHVPGEAVVGLLDQLEHESVGCL